MESISWFYGHQGRFVPGTIVRDELHFPTTCHGTNSYIISPSSACRWEREAKTMSRLMPAMLWFVVLELLSCPFLLYGRNGAKKSFHPHISLMR